MMPAEIVVRVNGDGTVDAVADHAAVPVLFVMAAAIGTVRVFEGCAPCALVLPGADR